jgi:hypothetical protein
MSCRTLFALLGLSLANIASAEAIRFRNDFGETAMVWIRPELNNPKKQWSQPPLLMGRGDAARVDLLAPGPYEFVVRDQLQRDEHCGTWNLHDVVAIDPNAEVSVQGFFETRTISRELTEYRSEQRTRTRSDGSVETYTVQVPETRMVHEVHQVRVPRLAIRSRGRVVRISEFLKSSKAPAAIGP